MIKINAGGSWSLTLADGSSLPAKVPGSVYADLLAAGRMEDPFWRDNEMAALALMDQDFTYSRGIELDAAYVESRHQWLRCEGLDTVADVSLNGTPLGHCENMHRTFELDVRGIAKAGENTLTVRFSSPTRFIKEKNAQRFVDGSTDAMAGFPQLRKAFCMFGWDWGPRLPDAGIWRDICFCASDTGRIDSVLITQHHAGGGVRLEFAPEYKDLSPEEAARATLAVTVTAPDGKTYKAANAAEDGLDIPDPQLWWPRGYGGQPLYTVEARLTLDGKTADSWTRRIGLRTMEMEQKKDEWGESFAHKVNGVAVFAMGGDYIPEDNLLPRVTPERTRRLLEDCAAANFNAVRIWGGGYYPDDFFFDACDELGLIVWEDFMIACAMIELDDEMRANLEAEFVDNVKRLRHHASLGLWCGNNEMEWQIDNGDWRHTPKQKSDYVRIYEHILPDIVKRHDPQRFYWPASPSSGGGFDAPNDPGRGDVHYWEVWHGLKPFSDYRNYYFRYASEFGFQSFPCLPTVESFTLPEDRNIFSYVMEKHQRNSTANSRILCYLGDNYLYPADFGTLLYASQLLQADAIKYGVEHWRRHRGRCMGAIYWQVNDCWPVASWASIDYYGRWKALHYAARRFFAPVLLSCCEEGAMTYGTNVNREGYDPPKTARLSVANETMEPFAGTVRWALRNAAGAVLQSGEEKVQVPALTSQWLEPMDFAGCDRYENYLSYSLHGAGGEEISSGSVLFCQPKHFRFQDPKLTVKAEGDTLTVTAAAYARSVELVCEDPDALLSDNYIDLNAGSASVKVLRGKPGRVWARSVFDIR